MIAASTPTSVICAESSISRSARIPRSRTSADRVTPLPGRMHSLFLRIFLLFLLAMTLIVGSSIATTFTIASRENEPLESQRRPSMAIQASEILARGGVDALKSWLQGNKTALGDRELFVVGPDGQDILGRRLPESAARRLAVVNGEAVPGNFRPSRAAPQILAADGSIYSVVMTPRRPSIFGALSL